MANIKDPVRLVAFDLDETLSLATFMLADDHLKCQGGGDVDSVLANINFESPWITGSRIENLSRMLEGLAGGVGSPRRVLTVLSRNQSGTGVQGIIKLLDAAGLLNHFSAIWTIPHREEFKCGAYQQAGKWIEFDPPTIEAVNKADVIHDVARNWEAWLPACGSCTLQDLKVHQIVLVDDQRCNFQSETGNKVLRYVKVARYDANYLHYGFLQNMGGIGAHYDSDFKAIQNFVNEPWLFEETYMLRCRDIVPPSMQSERISLVVFDFDETLTIATFTPDDPAFRTEIGWMPPNEGGELVKYNFESPYGEGDRVKKLKRLLMELTLEGVHLAVLTRNTDGAIAVLNLLLLADLAMPFSAIWTIPRCEGGSNGVWQDGSGRWKTFEPPVDQVFDHKVDVLLHMTERPQAWFPQRLDRQPSLLGLAAHKQDNPRHRSLHTLALEGIVLVDDERVNFSSASARQPQVLRQCKVARYDKAYWDSGVLTQLGGLGAHTDDDYQTLLSFVKQPWDFPDQTGPDPGPTLNGDLRISPERMRRMTDSIMEPTLSGSLGLGVSPANFQRKYSI